ncbi:MAG: type IV toxin-antitoxin system AbiEi family antitoxin domain-containing protein [Mycobacteriales bacterium]
MDLPDVFSLPDARACGISSQEVRTLVRRGWCVQLPYGGYARADVLQECEDDDRARTACTCAAGCSAPPRAW